MAGPTRIRITQEGGFAGKLERVDLDGTGLDERRLREMEQAGAQLTQLAARPEAETVEVGADLPVFVVEIEEEGAIRRFRLPGDRLLGAGLHEEGIEPIISRLRQLSEG